MALIFNLQWSDVSTMWQCFIQYIIDQDKQNNGFHYSVRKQRDRSNHRLPPTKTNSRHSGLGGGGGEKGW